VGWMSIPLLFPLRPFPVSRYCFTHVSPIPFPTLILSPPLSIQLRGLWKHCISVPQCTAKNGSQLQKLEGTKYTRVPVISQGWMGRVARVPLRLCYCPRPDWQPVAKVGGDQIHSGPRDLPNVHNYTRPRVHSHCPQPDVIVTAGDRRRVQLQSAGCSVLFVSRPRSEGWPHHGRTFSIYLCPLSF